ncbi:MAG: fused MFS/spermidine synthase [Thermoguttaceae bacterium]|jgi:spermidine synthase
MDLAPAVCCLGVSAFLTQVTLMRELLSAFSGNELVFGIVLGNWMLLTGLGSALGKAAGRLKSPHSVFVLAQVLVAVVPIGEIFLLRTMRNVVFIRGSEVGVTETVVTCCVLLAPYCITLGYLLTLASWLLAAEDRGGREGDSPIFVATKRSSVPKLGRSPTYPARKLGQSPTDAAGIGRVYFLDNLGSVLAGLLFSFVLVFLWSHFGILYAAGVLNLLAAGWVAARCRSWRVLGVALAVAAALGGLLVAVDLDELSTAIQYPGQRIVYRGHSPYGSLVVAEMSGQYNFMENGVVLFSTDNVQRLEETVHYAMSQRPKARRVLLVGGGVSGTAREVLKYGVEAVDYVELDPLVLEVGRRWLPANLADPRIHALATDGRLYVKQTRERYDVVILDVPDPSTSQLNRFYTREFFGEVRRILTPGGVLSLSIGHYDEGYLDPEMSRVFATTHRTLKEVFGNVSVIPGGKVFFAASDGPVTTEIAERIERAGIAARIVNRPYLAAMLAPSRMADIRRALAVDAPINRDFSPILYYYHLRYWMSQFKVRFGLFEAALLLLLAVYLVRIRPVPLAVFATGLAASSLEVVLLVGFQILCGSVYHQVGLVVTMFMLGLGVGAMAMNRGLARRRRGDLAWLLAVLAVFSACLPAALMGLGHLGVAAVSKVAIPLLTLVLAALVGMSFPLAAKLELTRPSECPDVVAVASRLYTADYIGASLGALWVSTLLIPLLGVVAVCLLTAGLCLLAGGILAATGRR